MTKENIYVAQHGGPQVKQGGHQQKDEQTRRWTNKKINKLDEQTKDGPTRRFSVTDFWKRLPVDQDEADSIGSRKHVVKDAKLVLQLNIFQFLQICLMAV